jgi:Ca-activated chloride channel family protein
MTFEWPLGLLALAVLPIALGLLFLARRRQARYAIRFSNVGILADVVESTRSPWRFVPPALLCAALAALAVGLARPQVSVTAARKQGTVVLALDRSGSMLAQDVTPDRITASRKAAQSFVKNLPSGFAVGVVSFSNSADVISAPSREKAAAQRAIAGIQAGGGTAIGDALQRSLAVLGITSATKPGSGKGRAILLLSDGSNTQGIDPSAATAVAKQAGVPIYTIALGTPDGQVQLRDSFGFLQRVQVPPDIEGLKRIAEVSGGKAFTATESSKLQQIYAGLGTHLSSRSEKREVTAAFAGGAILLLIAAGGLSLRWFGRLI